MTGFVPEAVVVLPQLTVSLGVALLVSRAADKDAIFLISAIAVALSGLAWTRVSDDAVATVAAENTAWDARRGVFRTLFKLDTAPPAETPIAKGFGEAGKLLNAWQAEGTAAGNRGDLLRHENPDWEYLNLGYFGAAGVGPHADRVHVEMEPGDTLMGMDGRVLEVDDDDPATVEYLRGTNGFYALLRRGGERRSARGPCRR